LADWPFSAAVRTAREGLSARAGLAAYRSAGGRVNDATWFRMVTEAKATVASRSAELTRPLNRRPTAGEATRWTTRQASGWMQNVEVKVRDRATNQVLTVPYSISSSRPVTRQQAIDAALATITPAGTGGDTQQILGAVYVSTLLMVPGGG
jgi:hypothetical protein